MESAKGARRLEGGALAKHVVAGASELVRNGLDRDHAVLLGPLAFVPAADRRVMSRGEVGRLDVCPAQIAVTAFAVAVAFELAVR